MLKKISNWIPFLVTLGLYVIPSIAMAGPFDPPPGDKSMEIVVKELFGPIVPGGGGTSPLSGVVAAFNVAVLIVGAILVAYTLVAGTMSTAHDGEMLGKRWSSLWVPIRTALGVAAILPIKAGFCFAQIVVIWLAVQGIGIADTVWAKYVNDAAKQPQIYIPPSANTALRDLIVNMMKSQACIIAGNEKVRETVDAKSVYLTTQGIQESASTGLVYGDHGGCGRIMVQVTPEKSGVKIEGNLAPFFNMQTFEARMYPVQGAQLIAANKALMPLTQKIVSSNDPNGALRDEVNAAIDKQVKEWTKALQTAALAAYKDATNDDLMKSITKEGWLMAGMWYVKFAKAQDAVSRGISAIPAVGNRASANSAFLEVGPFDAAAVEQALKRVEEMTRNNLDKSGNLISAVGKEEGGMAGKIISFFINDDLNAIAGFGSNVNLNQNPVLMAANLGSNMSAWGWSAWLAGVALGAASSSTVLGNGVGPGLAMMISPMVTALAGTLIVAGATLSTYVPMLPYILWIGVAFGWVVLLVEAVIAAPLWAVTHLAPDGDGVVGRGGQGYMLVLSLTLRPALMIIGFVAAIILMKPLGYLINSTFMGAFITNVSPSLGSIIQIITGCVIYTLLMVSVITRIFALIHVIPDRLLRWIGGGGSNDLGQEAHGIESHTGAKAVAGVAAAQQIGQAGQQGLQNARSHNAQERNRLSTDATTAAQSAANKADQSDRQAKSFEGRLAGYEGSNGQGPQGSASQDGAMQEGAEMAANSATSKAVGFAEAAVAAGKAAERSPRNSDPQAEEKRQQKIAAGRSAAAFLGRHEASGAGSGDPSAIRNFLSKEAARSAKTGIRGDWEMAAAQGASLLSRTDSAISSIREARNSAPQASANPSSNNNGGGDDEPDGSGPSAPGGAPSGGGNGNDDGSSGGDPAQGDLFGGTQGNGGGPEQGELFAKPSAGNNNTISGDARGSQAATARGEGKLENSDGKKNSKVVEDSPSRIRKTSIGPSEDINGRGNNR